MTLEGADTARPTFTAPNRTADYTLTFHLAVANTAGSADDAVTITVTADNDAPTAEAGTDQNVAARRHRNPGRHGQLGPGGQDPDLCVDCAPRGRGYPQRPHRDRPTFVAPDDRTADYDLAFSLTVTDDSGLASVSDTVTISVGVNNNVPVAKPARTRTFIPGTWWRWTPPGAAREPRPADLRLGVDGRPRRRAEQRLGGQSHFHRAGKRSHSDLPGDGLGRPGRQRQRRRDHHGGGFNTTGGAAESDGDAGQRPGCPELGQPTG